MSKAIITTGSKNQRSTLLLVALALFALLSGCATNPVTGDSNLMFMPESWDRQVGAQQYAPSLQSQGGKYNVEPELSRYVSRVGQRLAQHADLQLDYEFTVLNSDVPNAWALPGGKIAINRGLLTELNSEAELAAVLGHEIVHAAARHGAQAQSRGTLLSGAVMAAGIASRNSEYSQLAALGAGLGAQLINTRYGREAELESDEYGIRYMVAAGYDPQGAVDLQATFVRLSEGRNQDWLSGLFASHPPSRERLRKNRELAASFASGGEIGKQRYQQQMQPLLQSQDAYAEAAKARQALQDSNPDAARRHAQAAIQAEPRESRFYGLMGDIARAQQRDSEAVHYYEQAIARDPDWFYFPLARGILRQRANNSSGARQDLQRSLKLLPTGTGYYYLGVLEKRTGNRDLAIRYLQSAQQAGGEIAQRANAELQTMQ